MGDKPHLNLVFIGHVDHGKSTLIGRLLYETGSIDERVIEKYGERADQLGKKSFKFAWAIDKIQEERERGLTIDVAWNEFETDKFKFTIIDAPGHADFVKNMITGANEADAAVLVVDAEEGIMPQTREHMYLAKALGVEQLIVAINKMDIVDYQKKNYEKVKKDLKRLTDKVGFNIKHFVPVSAFEGAGITDKKRLEWYKGPTFLEALNDFKEPKRLVNKPLRMPIDKVLTIKGAGVVAIGKVKTGSVEKGEEVFLQPSGVKARVKQIEQHQEEIEEAKPGNNVGINLKEVDKKDVKKGDVICKPKDKISTARKGDKILARVAVLEHPRGLTKDHVPTIFAHTARVPGKILSIEEKIDSKTGETTDKNPNILKKGEVGTMLIEPQKLLALDTAEEVPKMSRFALRESGKTVAVGIYQEIK